MLSFEIAKLDQIAIYLDQAGLESLIKVLSKLAKRKERSAVQIVLEVEKGDCRLSETTPFDEASVKEVVLNYLASRQRKGRAHSSGLPPGRRIGK